MQLPPEITQLAKLDYLDLRQNPLPIPPEILGRYNDPAAILDYYFQQVASARKPLNEAKVILVGQGSVGKTSLVKRVLYNTFDPHESKTDGINIQRWIVPMDGQDVRLNVWDFGGQEIMHATHQFFLTKRSLYLLVLDSRVDDQENRIEYWLKLVESFSDNAPIIVVSNKVDQNALELDRRGLQQKYPNIKAFIATSCADGRGIADLRAAITREIAQLPHVHDQLLANWFAVKTQLEDIGRDWIPYSEYEQICAQRNITDDLSRRTLIRLLHDLGTVLNFQDDPRLADTNILKPEWVTNGVYRILNSHALFESKGVLMLAQLTDIIDLRIYPRAKRNFITDMMRKFELCFEFEGEPGKFLIPELLGKEEPDTGTWDDALSFQYHYNVLPSSVISRFIVRMHAYISKRIYWRNGVVLADVGCRALVKADREDKKIFIAITGDARRREFLAIIRSQFDAIHASIAKLEAKEKVAVPGRPDIVVDYENLLTMEEQGMTEFIPIGMKEKVSVRELFNGVESEDARRGRRTLDDMSERIIQMGDIGAGAVVSVGQSTAATAKTTETNAPVFTPTPEKNNPWIVGSFYMLVLVVVVTTFAILSNNVSWYALPLVLIAGLLAVGIIGAMQLRNDERLSDKSFAQLIVETYKQLPLLKNKKIHEGEARSRKFKA